MERVKPRTLSGFMELLPAPQQRFERMLEILRDTFSRYGFTPIDTPIIEAAEVLLAKGGGETEKQIYRFQKGDNDLALRFDQTVPLAKYAALHENELCFPFRRYAIGKVFRGERAQRGRFREFYQADIDIIGDGKLSVLNEAEIPAIIYQVFRRFGLTRFCIRVNNRKLLNGFYAILDLSEQAQSIMRTVDKLDKIGADKVCGILTDELDIDSEKAKRILDFLAIDGSNEDVLSMLERYTGIDETYDTGLKELRQTVQYLADFGVPEENFRIDLSIARGLDYYTGTVYETTMTDYPQIGAICAGGRYDNLAQYYSSRSLPGVGVAIGLTRLFYVLDEQGLFDPEFNAAPADCLVIPMGGELSYAISLATYLRASGIRTQIFFEEKKFKAKIQYADKLGIPFAVFVGEDEIAGNTCTVKHLTDGVQRTLGREDARAWIAGEIEKENSRTLICEK